MLAVGDKVPETILRAVDSDGQVIETDVPTLSIGRRLALIGVPGAFTPTCSEIHIPGYVSHAESLKAAGIDEIGCLCMADHFVMSAWSKARDFGKSITMLADGNGDFTTQSGMQIDLSRFGLGIRSHRYAAIISDGIVRWIAIEPKSGKLTVSTVQQMLQAIASNQSQ